MISRSHGGGSDDRAMLIPVVLTVGNVRTVSKGRGFVDVMTHRVDGDRYWRESDSVFAGLKLSRPCEFAVLTALPDVLS